MESTPGLLTMTILSNMMSDELEERAEHLYKSKQYEAAITVYNHGIARHGLLPDLYLGRALAKVALKQFSSAISDVNDAMCLPSLPCISLLLELGDRFRKARRFKFAIDVYCWALIVYPSSQELFLGRARAYMAVHKFSQALADCNSGESLYSGFSMPAVVLRAKCLVLLGDPESALRACALPLGQVSLATDQSLTSVVSAATTLSALKSQYRSDIDSGRWPEAGYILNKMEDICENGHGPNWLCWQAEISVVARNFLEWYYWRDSFDQEQLPEPQFLCGLIHFLENNLCGAHDHVDRALSLDPSHTRAQDLLLRIRMIEDSHQIIALATSECRWDDVLNATDNALHHIEERPAEAGGGLLRAAYLIDRAVALCRMLRYTEAETIIENIPAAVTASLPSSAFKSKWVKGLISMGSRDFGAALSAFHDARTLLEAPDSENDRALAEDEMTAYRRHWHYYDVLGLEARTSDVDAIKRAYKKLALKTHPDKTMKDSAPFDSIKKAYDVLSDPPSKARYDNGERTP